MGLPHHLCIFIRTYCRYIRSSISLNFVRQLHTLRLHLICVFDRIPDASYQYVAIWSLQPAVTMPYWPSSKVPYCAMTTRSFAYDPPTPSGAMRLPVRFNIGNANAVLDVFLEAFQLVTITMQILPQSSASSVDSVSAQYEQAASYLRIPNLDWWTLYWKLALVIAFIWLTSLVFIEVKMHAFYVMQFFVAFPRFVIL